MATSINKKLRQFAKENNHRLVGFMFESERKTKFTFEGCVRVEDVAEVDELMSQIIKLSFDAKRKDGAADGTEPSLDVG